jgi:hypothetical protein
MGLFDKFKSQPAKPQVTVEKIRKHCESKLHTAQHSRNDTLVSEYVAPLEGEIEAYEEVIGRSDGRFSVAEIRKYCEKEGKKNAKFRKEHYPVGRYPEKYYNGEIKAYDEVIAFIKGK